jgi:amino acid adenylation domain-containing protein
MADAARRYGDRTAIVDGDVAVGYAELDGMISALAKELTGLGVDETRRIGIYAPRGLGAVVAIYAALRCGAVVASLDVADPPRRTAQMIAGSGIDVLLSGAAVRSKAETIAANMDEGGAPVRVGDGFVLHRAPAASGPLLAGGGYVFFTSGSTGRPKGVLLSHANILHFVEWAAGELRLGPDDRLGAQSALTFDLSTVDLFAGAMAGACVELLPDRIRPFAADIVRWLGRREITVFYAVPTLYHMLIQVGAIDQNPPAALRIAAFAGEPFSPVLLERYRKAFTRTEFYNLYGPTETNVCTYHKIPDEWTAGQEIPIGQPIPGVDVALFDGEIYVSGPTVFQGYLKDGELHDALETVRFPDGRRLRAYPTGDLARRDDDGRFVLRGRRDGQVKRRGYRIELLDIESALQELPGVDLCAVVAGKGEHEGEIWAYVAGADIGERNVHGELARTLPRHMLPDRVVPVRRLPTTGHGKVDRRWLGDAVLAEETV